MSVLVLNQQNGENVHEDKGREIEDAGAEIQGRTFGTTSIISLDLWI